MKTAISLPDSLFAQVEVLVKASGRSRSEVYAAALREYVARHAADEITRSYNEAAAAAAESELDPFVAEASRLALLANEW